MATPQSTALRSPFAWRAATLLAILVFVFVRPEPGLAAEAGMIKTTAGDAWVERSGTRIPARVGDTVRESDVVVTGRDGAVGITFADNSRMSIGPSSVLAIDRFAFDSTTHAGVFDTSLRRGTLGAVSGKLTRQSADAMKVRTPGAILGVRGTHFFVRTGEAD